MALTRRLILAFSRWILNPYHSCWIAYLSHFFYLCCQVCYQYLLMMSWALIYLYYSLHRQLLQLVDLSDC